MTDRTAWRVLTWNIHGCAHGPTSTSSPRSIDRLAARRRGAAGDPPRAGAVARRRARLAGRVGDASTTRTRPLSGGGPKGWRSSTPHRGRHDRSRRSLSPGVSTWTFRHRVVLAATGRRADASLRVYDVHLAAHRQPDERIAQAELAVAAMIADERPPTAVVAGDLNARGRGRGHPPVPRSRPARSGRRTDPSVDAHRAADSTTCCVPERRESSIAGDPSGRRADAARGPPSSAAGERDHPTTALAECVIMLIAYQLIRPAQMRSQ